MHPLISRIKQLATEAAAETVALRHHLHAHPELSFQEHNTVAFVTEQLRKLGLQPQPIADTGVVALIEGRNPAARTVALRADMDALPITEQNEVPYKSQNPGVMHACGHDVHTSSLLGAARILVALKDEFEGSVKLMFQPGEELLPGGASLMIAGRRAGEPQAGQRAGAARVSAAAGRQDGPARRPLHGQHRRALPDRARQGRARRHARAERRPGAGGGPPHCGGPADCEPPRQPQAALGAVVRESHCPGRHQRHSE